MQRVLLALTLSITITTAEVVAASGERLSQWQHAEGVTLLALIKQGYTIVQHSVLGDPSWTHEFFLLQKGASVYVCQEIHKPSNVAISCQSLVEPYKKK